MQTLIEGTGATVTEKSTVTAQYTGWVLGGDAKKPLIVHGRAVPLLLLTYSRL